MSTLRAAVIGVGYLGNFHAQKYLALPGVTLVGVADTDAERVAAVAANQWKRMVILPGILSIRQRCLPRSSHISEA